MRPCKLGQFQREDGRRRRRCPGTSEAVPLTEDAAECAQVAALRCALDTPLATVVSPSTSPSATIVRSQPVFLGRPRRARSSTPSAAASMFSNGRVRSRSMTSANEALVDNVTAVHARGPEITAA